MARVKRAVNAQKTTRDSRQGQWLPRAALAAIPQAKGQLLPLRVSTPTTTARTAKATSVVCGSSGSMPPPARTAMTYNQFIQGLRVAGVEIDRRMLAELAVNDRRPSPRWWNRQRRLCLQRPEPMTSNSPTS